MWGLENEQGFLTFFFFLFSKYVQINARMLHFDTRGEKGADILHEIKILETISYSQQ